MTMERIERIYLRHLDTSIVFIPVDAAKIYDNAYKILDNSEFDDFGDPQYLFEFYPGDIVELGPHEFSDGTFDLVASTLLTAGQWPNRKLSEFLFKAFVGQIPIDKASVDKYADEIEQIRQRKDNGEDFYNEISDTVNKLTMINQT